MKNNYELVKKVVDSYEDEDMMEDFLDEFEVGENISEEKFFEFFESYMDDMSDIYYIRKNWKWVNN